MSDQTFVDIDTRISNYKEESLSHLPRYMHDCHSDSLTLNWQIIEWYRREMKYIFWFRILFAFMYYSVPFTSVSFLRFIDVIDAQTGAVLELLFTSFYTGPIFSRMISEIRYFMKYFDIKELIAIQLDIPVVVGIYLTSASTSGDKNHLIALLTGTGISIPSFILWIYCFYKRYTMYAFGFSSEYHFIPKPLRENFETNTPTIKERITKVFTEDGETVKNIGKHVVKRVSNIKNIPAKLHRKHPSKEVEEQQQQQHEDNENKV